MITSIALAEILYRNINVRKVGKIESGSAESQIIRGVKTTKKGENIARKISRKDSHSIRAKILTAKDVTGSVSIRSPKKANHLGFMRVKFQRFRADFLRVRGQTKGLKRRAPETARSTATEIIKETTIAKKHLQSQIIRKASGSAGRAELFQVIRLKAILYSFDNTGCNVHRLTVFLIAYTFNMYNSLTIRAKIPGRVERLKTAVRGLVILRSMTEKEINPDAGNVGFMGLIIATSANDAISPVLSKFRLLYVRFFKIRFRHKRQNIGVNIERSKPGRKNASRGNIRIQSGFNSADRIPHYNGISFVLGNITKIL